MSLTRVLVVVTGTAAAIACSASGGGLDGKGGTGGGDGAGGLFGTGSVPGAGSMFSSGGQGGTFQSGGAANAGGAGGVIVPPGTCTPAIVECNDQATLEAFRAGGPDGGMRILYPYDETLFPRGLLSPVVQWSGGSGGDAVYLKIQTQESVYEGCFPGATAPFQQEVPLLAWANAGECSNGFGDPAVVTLGVRSGGTVNTITTRWNFALARIKGAIYYNTYGSPQALAAPFNAAGAVLKIIPGAPIPEVFISVPGVPPFGPCISCHSLSADGSTMTANNHSYPLGPYVSASYTVNANGVGATLRRDGLPEAGFAGLYRDGTKVVTNGPPNSVAPGMPGTSATFPMAPNNVPALIGPAESHLVDTTSGMILGPGPALHAQMPTFSPDGTLVAYNNHDEGGGHSLWVANFDNATNTFSNQREIFRDNTRFPGWPFITGDNKSVIFVLGNRDDFVSQLPPLGAPPEKTLTGRSHLMITYLDSPGSATALDLANGWRNGQFYPPGGVTRDNDLEFFPTMSPVAAGGYFWVFFTSRRSYGNTTFPGQIDPNNIEDLLTKKIWVTAISFGGTQGTDPSHPAFYLREQEAGSGNIRAFATLEPCKEDGSVCTSGTDCCNGFCIDGICRPPAECANLDDRCETADDCCDDRLLCLGGYCAEEPIE